MTMRLKDVQPGMCWRFTSDTAPDQRNTYTLLDEETSDAPTLPRNWDDHYWEDADSDDLSDFFKKHHAEPIQLLMHYTKAPEGRPIEDYEAVPASKVRALQWYLGGEWNEASAKSVAHSLNRQQVKTSSYRSGHGPTSDNGWAVVRTMPVAVTEPTRPVVRSCIDPLDRMLTTLRCQMSGGVNGIECLWRFEYAQRYEQLVRTQHGHVSTNSEYPMDEGQVALAQELWAVELKVKQRDAKTKEHNRLVCDSVVEMPNMADVP